jgi:hypothetical protein
MNPTPPLTRSPMKAFARSPKTWIPMMPTASRHPQGLRLTPKIVNSGVSVVTPYAVPTSHGVTSTDPNGFP